MFDERPIGVFDSGIGGLTVVKELFARVPDERIVYFGDTARLPYGSKSAETVKRYAIEDAELLLAHEVKLIVVACNTVSATALEEVCTTAGKLPVIGMILPSAREAVRRTKTGRIGIIGTEATVASKAYELALESEASKHGRKITPISRACPLFVPLAEEGWTDHTATQLIVEEYLTDLKSTGIDTLILGCTHYPVLEAVIRRVMGPTVSLINSGAVAAGEVQSFLPARAGIAQRLPNHLMLVSDVPRKFQRMAERFLGCELPEVHQVDFKESWVIRSQPISQLA